MNDPNPNTIDELIDSILSNPDPTTLTPADIDALIAYHRAERESGAKPKREGATKSAPTKADTAELLKSIGAVRAEPTITPAKPGSFRRF